MSYFIPNFLQKRILRYVLSKLEVLDTDTIGLDKLDITWGRTSSIELKDVGIHLHKAASLLRLPSYWRIRHANLQSLRITIPADLHQSGILIAIEGFSVNVQFVPSESDGRGPSLHGKSPESVSSHGTTRDQSQVHDPGGHVLREESTSTDDPQIDVHAAAAHLAESYLLDEEQQNKEELQSALHSQQLNRSLSSNASSEEAPALGVGGDLSLPTFLADFLEGVLDRVELLIEDVQIDLTLHINVPQKTKPSRESPSKRDEITFRVTLGQVRVDGMKSISAGSEHLQEGPSRSYPHGSRRINLKDLKLTLISGSSIFWRIVPSSTPSSPSTGHSDDFSASGSDSTETPTPWIEAKGSVGRVTQLQDGNIIVEHGSALRKTRTPTSSASSEIKSSTDEGDGENSCLRGTDTSIDSPPISANGSTNTTNNILDLASASFADIVELSRAEPRPGSTVPHATEGNHLEVSRPTTTPLMCAYGGPLLTAQDYPGDSAVETQSDPRSSSTEDLTESRLFTHDEAASMYMSALDQFAEQDSDSPIMPGAWLSNSSKRKPEELEPAPQPTEAVSKMHVSKATSSSTPKSDQNESRSSSQLAAMNETFIKHSERDESPYESSPDKSQNTLHRPGASLPRSEDSAELLVSRELASMDYADLLCTLPKKNHVKSASAAHYVHTQSDANTDILPFSFDTRMGELDIVADMSLMKLISLVLQEVATKNFGSNIEPPIKPVTSKMDLRIKMQHLRWRFVDRLATCALSRAGLMGKLNDHKPLLKDADVLLKADLKDIDVQYEKAISYSTFQSVIGEFAVGYAQEDMISFDSHSSVRKPHRDVLVSRSGDVSLILRSSSGAGRSSIDVSTRPLRINLDLRRLDETFGWFGGLSSVLELGNSVATTITPKDRRNQTGSEGTKRLKVHFEPKDERSLAMIESNSSSGKFNIRIEGLNADIQGEHATLQVTASALKAIARPEGLGVQIDNLQVTDSRPIADGRSKRSSSNLRNIRIEYLQTPRDIDLARLIELVFPSQLQEADQFKDGLMVDTLLRQRKQGSVIRITIDSLSGDVEELSQLRPLATLRTDLAKLSTVAKYLPEDDRPGILVLVLLKKLSIQALANKKIGIISSDLRDVEIAYVTLPLLAAVGIKSLAINHNANEELISTSLPSMQILERGSPVILARFIGNEMVPIIRIRLHDLRFEYSASLLIAVSELGGDALSDELLHELADSIAALTYKPDDDQPSIKYRNGNESVNFPNVQLVASNVLLGLAPRATRSKGYVVIEDATFDYVQNLHQRHYIVSIEKAVVAVIDNNRNTFDQRLSKENDNYIDILIDAQYAPVATLHTTKVDVQVSDNKADRTALVSVDVNGGLLLIESCADSNFTLMRLINLLGPPPEKSPELKYRMETVPLTDMLASFTGNAYYASEASESGDDKNQMLAESSQIERDPSQNNIDQSTMFDSDIGIALDDSDFEQGFDSIIQIPDQETSKENVKASSEESSPREPVDHDDLVIRNDHFTEANFLQKIGQPSAIPKQLEAKVRDFHVIWNLFDGFDWQKTRDEISRATAALQSKAKEHVVQSKGHYASYRQEDDENIIGDFLFNSIYIGIPTNHEPENIVRQVNQNIHDAASETRSHATWEGSDHDRSQDQPRRPHGEKLRLGRSRSHKITFELKSVSVDFDLFPPATGETQNTLDVRINDLEVFDHLPTSTWKKFATYMRDAGEREKESPMIHLQIDTVKPVADLVATEMLLKVIRYPQRPLRLLMRIYRSLSYRYDFTLTRTL